MIREKRSGEEKIAPEVPGKDRNKRGKTSSWRKKKRLKGKKL